MFFWVYLVFLEVFAVPSPSVQKLEEKQKKTKKNPVRRILGKSIQDCFLFVCLVYLVFLEVFAVPSPIVQKLEEKQKKTKKNPVRRILGKSIQDCFFLCFGLFGFSRGFCCPKPNCPKIGGNRIIYVNMYIYIYVYKVSLQNRLSNYLFKKEVGSRKKN